MKFKFYTCKITASKDVTNLTYKVTLPFGVSIDSVATAEGTDINYTVMGNKITGIDIPSGESIVLCITLTASIEGEIKGYGEWCDLNVKKDHFCYISEGGGSDVGGGSEEDDGEFFYIKCESQKKDYEVSDQDVFEITIPAGKTLDQSSVCVFANGVLVNSTLAGGPTDWAVKTDVKFGEPTDLCKITIKYSCCERIKTVKGCYEKTVGHTAAFPDTLEDSFKLCPTEGCTIDKDSVCLYVQGIFQHSMTVTCLSGDDEGCLNVTVQKGPNSDPTEPCDITIKWNEVCLSCGEDEAEPEPPTGGEDDLKDIVSGWTEKWCKDNAEVVFDVCKLKSGNNSYVGSDGLNIQGGSADLIVLGYTCGPCAEVAPEQGKSQILNFFGEITDDTKLTWVPEAGIDTISVGVTDNDQCNYVRVTYICPDGQVGCTLISPTQPYRSIMLKDYDQITEVCFEVVERDSGATVKDWNVIAPTTPLEINVDGLDIN